MGAESAECMGKSSLMSSHRSTVAGDGGHLGRGHDDVEHAEVLLEAVAHKDGARIYQVAQLEVRRLVRGEVVPRQRRVQITRHLRVS